jgi:hypothetical protein
MNDGGMNVTQNVCCKCSWLQINASYVPSIGMCSIHK